mmetsp:Transcript_52552/g.132103  ORF Transcript_52552/g.132103 Transcript_52552/m.132103 type:complete len:98 (+) Transcript_52552:641-934(+)
MCVCFCVVWRTKRVRCEQRTADSRQQAALTYITIYGRDIHHTHAPHTRTHALTHVQSHRHEHIDERITKIMRSSELVHTHTQAGRHLRNGRAQVQCK